MIPAALRLGELERVIDSFLVCELKSDWCVDEARIRERDFAKEFVLSACVYVFGVEAELFSRAFNSNLALDRSMLWWRPPIVRLCCVSVAGVELGWSD